jgi:hypothetical protein
MLIKYKDTLINELTDKIKFLFTLVINIKQIEENLSAKNKDKLTEKQKYNIINKIFVRKFKSLEGFLFIKKYSKNFNYNHFIKEISQEFHNSKILNHVKNLQKDIDENRSRTHYINGKKLSVRYKNSKVNPDEYSQEIYIEDDDLSLGELRKKCIKMVTTPHSTTITEHLGISIKELKKNENLNENAREKEIKKIKTLISKKIRNSYKNNIFINTINNINDKHVYNIGSNDDSCPICQQNWKEGDLIVVLTCSHAYCFNCAIDLYLSNIDNKMIKPKCSICRKHIKGNLIHIVFNQIIKYNLIDCVTIYKPLLNFTNDEYYKLIVKLFIENKCKINKISNVLFNISTIVYTNKNEYEMTSEMKQEIFYKYRQPIQLIKTKITELRKKIFHLDNEDKTILQKDLEELYIILSNAKMDISRQIYSTINNSNNLNKIKSDCIYVDLHSLLINEAMDILHEFVLPVVSLYKRIHIITGKGNHNIDNISPLKESVKSLLDDKGVNYYIGNNEGVLILTN